MKAPTKVDHLRDKEHSASKLAESVATHLQRTGTFRATDILRVLGKPLESVDVKAKGQYGSFYQRHG